MRRGSFLDGRASVTAVAADSPLTNDAAADDYPSLVEARDGTLWTAYQAYTDGAGDQVLVRHQVQRRVVGGGSR